MTNPFKFLPWIGGLILHAGLASAALGDEPSPLLEAPWQEAVISVRDLDSTARFFLEIGGFEEVARGTLSREEINYWHLDPGVSGEFLLLRAPGSGHGHIRFVRFKGAEQVPVRLGARAWDSGGYFSLMMRAHDLKSVYADALVLGWHAESEPVYFDFGSSVLANVVLKGPDGINIALYERLSPPLDEFWQFERLSQPFNAMQMVADIEPADDFFTAVLGMDYFWSGDYVDPAPGPNNFGLPQNLTTEIPRRTRILQPRPGETGRLELMQFVGLDGRDLSDRAQPPNLGIMSVRYPVADAEQALEQIRATGKDAWRGPSVLDLQPYGKLRMFAVRAPDGALVEIYSPVETGSADEVIAAMKGVYDNAAQYAAAPDELKVAPSVDGDWLDHQHADFSRVDAPEIGDNVVYLEWRSGGAEGPISRQRIWSFRTDDSGAVRMDFHAFVDGSPWAGRARDPGAFHDLGPDALRSYGPDCALRFKPVSDGGWVGSITASECSLEAASGRRMGIEARVEIGTDGTITYRESGRLESGDYAFRVPPGRPYRFIRQ